MSKLYLSPSNQTSNIGVGNYGNEAHRCNQIADIVERELKNNGIEIKRWNQKQLSFSQMIVESNNWKPDIHFSIHTNAGGGSGTEIFAYAPNTNSDKLAKIVNRDIASIMPFPNRGVKYSPKFDEVQKTIATANLIEIIFHDNLSNVNWFLENMELIGKTLTKSILEYLGIKYNHANPVEPTAPTSPTKSIDELAREVIDGKWANQPERQKRLEAAGYNFSAIQTRVNEILGYKPTSAETTYTVKKDDNLSSIAAKYNTTWQKLYEKNKTVIGSNPNLIYPGQVLKI